MSRLKFAAFIMTYERPGHLCDSIKALLSQTIIPEKILVIDNNEKYETYTAVNELKESRVEYLRVGYNSGPAGAAKIGLQKLVDEGYTWIYWGDDDDPPHFDDCFEKLLKLATREKDVGIVGVVGQYFNPLFGELRRVSDQALQVSEFLEVDSIAGNQCMIINATVVRQGVLPNESLFFGFEELEYCLKVKKLGFKLLVSCELFLRLRQKFNKLNYNRGQPILRNHEALKREYYSVRNMIIILVENSLYFGLINRIVKSLARGLYGFRNGARYGLMNFKYIVTGILHGTLKISGKRF